MYIIAVFLLLCANTTGTSFGHPKGLPTVAKEVGFYPTGTLRRGQSHNYKDKILKNKQCNYLLI